MAKSVRGPALIACFLLFVVGIAIAGIGVAGSISDDPKPPQRIGGGVPETASARGVPILGSIQASQELARALAVLHPSATSDFSPTGIACASDDLIGSFSSENGAGGKIFTGVNIANQGSEACDLPVISGFEGFDAAGYRLFSESVTPSDTCKKSLPFCVAKIPLPLAPGKLPSNASSPVEPGTAIVVLMQGGGCAWWSWTPPASCTVVSMTSIVLNFQDEVRIEVPIPTRVLVSGRFPAVVTVRLITD